MELGQRVTIDMPNTQWHGLVGEVVTIYYSGDITVEFIDRTFETFKSKHIKCDLIDSFAYKLEFK